MIDVPLTWDKHYPFLLPYEVRKRLKDYKKPKSMTAGDIFPQLVTAFSDLIAVPLTKIFNLILWTYHWPIQWKLETVTIIPKNSNASSYAECRNLSCTPLFSKVCESYMMDRITSEVRIDTEQYGGVKKCGVEHLLLKSWDNILNGLEDNHGSVNLISIDYAKAFNRMSHQACLKAFYKKGASNQSLNLIAAFLSNRRMSVKINSSYSSQRKKNGGSPQGSVSANALFCGTIEFLQEGSLEETANEADLAVEQDHPNSYSYFAGALILEDIPFEENCGPASPLPINERNGMRIMPISPRSHSARESSALP